MTDSSRRLTDNERRQVVQYWQWLQDLISENYGAGRLLRTQDDLYWLQRIIDEQLLWDERDAHHGIAAAIGEAIVNEHESVEWEVVASEGLGLGCHRSGNYWPLFAEVLRRFDKDGSLNVDSLYAQVVTELVGAS